MAVSKRAALFTTTLSSFLVPFISSAVNVALPSIGKEFHLNAVTLSWISASFLLSSAAFMVPLGRFADIYGRKRLFLRGIILFTVFSLLSSVAGNAGILIAMRVIQGVGGAMIMATAIALLIAVFPPHDRGRVLGINVAATYTGLSFGPFIGGFLTERFGWRSIFLVTVPLGVAIILFVLLRLKDEWADAQGESFDVAGASLYTVALLCIMYGLAMLRTPGGPWYMLAGAAGLVFFILRETRIPFPVLNVRLFSGNRVFALSNLAALINYSATFSVSFLLSLYLQYVKGFSPLRAGLILVAQPLLQVIFSPFAGRLSDRSDPRIVSSIGMGLTVFGLLPFVFLERTTSLTFILAGLATLGTGFAFFSSPNTNAVMGSVEKKFYGIASGTLGTMRLTGQMTSMAVALLVFSAVMGEAPITPGRHALLLVSVRISFIISTILCAAGVFASLARGSARAPGAPPARTSP